jgi:hypothetical protein
MVADGPHQRENPANNRPAEQQVDEENPAEVVRVPNGRNNRRKEMERQYRQTEKRKEQKVHGIASHGFLRQPQPKGS